MRRAARAGKSPVRGGPRGHRARSDQPCLTAVSTTVVGFLPVFSMVGAEGKLFRPLAFTKTFALVGSIVVGAVDDPGLRPGSLFRPRAAARWIGCLRCAVGSTADRARSGRAGRYLINGLAILLPSPSVLASHWEPLGPERGSVAEPVLSSCCAVLGLLLGRSRCSNASTSGSCAGASDHKAPVPLACPTGLVLLGSDHLAGRRTGCSRFVPGALESGSGVAGTERAVERALCSEPAASCFPGLGKEFMPEPGRGRPTSSCRRPRRTPRSARLWTCCRSSISPSRAFPRSSSRSGKIGRVESALDPAPVSMVETVVNYAARVRHGRCPTASACTFRVRRESSDEYERDGAGDLVDPGSRRASVPQLAATTSGSRETTSGTRSSPRRTAAPVR